MEEDIPRVQSRSPRRQAAGCVRPHLRAGRPRRQRTALSDFYVPLEVEKQVVEAVGSTNGVLSRSQAGEMGLSRF